MAELIEMTRVELHGCHTIGLCSLSLGLQPVNTCPMSSEVLNGSIVAYMCITCSAELSNGPTKKRSSPQNNKELSIECTKEYFSPPEESRGKRSRAQVRDDNAKKKRDGAIATQHAALLEATLESNRIDAFKAQLAHRKQRLRELDMIISDPLISAEHKERASRERLELLLQQMPSVPTVAVSPNPQTNCQTPSPATKTTN